MQRINVISKLFSVEINIRRRVANCFGLKKKAAGILPGDPLRVIECCCYQLLSGPRTRPVTAGSGLGAAAGNERNKLG